MKKKFTLFYLLLQVTAINVQAQTQFLNNGFETWEQKTVNGYKFTDPQSWSTLNELQQFGFDETTSMSNSAHSGNYSAHLISAASPFGNIPGLLTIKPIMDAQGNPDLDLNYMPFTGRPGYLSFWYKSFPETNDANGMFMLLTKWNSATQSKDTIGMAEWSMDSTVSEYTQAMIAIEYFSTATPDSISFLISSSDDGFDPVPGSELFVDDIVFIYSSGVEEAASINNVKVWPNPAAQVCYVDNYHQYNKIVISDLSGRTIQEVSMGSNEGVIDIAGFAPGMYVLNFYDTSLEFAGTMKLIKE